MNVIIINIFVYILLILGVFIQIMALLYAFITLRALVRGVPFLPLDIQLLEVAVDALQLSDGDHFIDIGAGNGRVCNYVYSRISGKKVVIEGVEVEGLLWLWSQVSRKVFRTKVFCHYGDAFAVDYSGYNKIFMYTTSEFIAAILPKLLEEVPSESIIVSCVSPFTLDIVKQYKNDRIRIKK